MGWCPWRIRRLGATRQRRCGMDHPSTASRFSGYGKVPAAPLGVKGINPALVIEHGPELIGLERAQVERDGDENVTQALFVQRQRKMMVVDDVVAFLRP